MRNYFLLACVLLFPSFVFAQSCSGYYYLRDHTEIEMTTYDRQGDPAVVVTSRVADVSSVPGGEESKFESTVKDKDGKVLEQGSGTAKCLQGNLSVDMRATMPSGSMKQFQNMQMKADVSYLEYPSNMSVGQVLPDASFHMEIYKKESSRRFATVDYTISNRKVEGKEEITTSAGKWNCFKISYDLKMRMKIGIGIPMQFTVTEWFAPGFGIVKTEDYSRKGKNMGSTVLTALKKG